MRSYIIIAFYSLLVAAFYKWEASLFLMIVSMSIELFILWLGILILRFSKKLPEKKGRNEGSINLTAILGLAVVTYIIARGFGEYYSEFSDIEITNVIFQPIWEFKESIIVISLSLGVGYFVDIKQLRLPQRKDAILFEVFRLAILIFVITMACALLPLFYHEIYDTKVLFDKWILIIISISLRVFIEIWYMKQAKKEIN